MRVDYGSRISISLDSLTSEQVRDLQREFTYENPTWKKLKAMRKRFSEKKVPRFISTWRMSGGNLTVPRGGINKVREVLGSLRVRKRTSLGEPELRGKIPSHKLPPREYQTRMMRAGVDRLNSLWRSPPGSGKTTAAFMLAAEVNVGTLVVVPTEKIFLQWIRRAEKDLGLRAEDVGYIQGPNRCVKPLTIGMQQTLKNCAGEYLHLFGCEIGDEAQRFAADTFFDVVDCSSAAYRIGVTANEKRADGKEFLIYDVFGPVDVEVSRTELIAAGAIVDATIRVIPSNLELPWYAELKPNKRMGAKVQDALALAMGEDAERNDLLMQILGWCAYEGQTTITLTRRREHCATLNTMAIAAGYDSGLLMGGADSKPEFQRTEREMSEGSLKQAVGTYQAVGVGFDLPAVSRGIFGSPCANSATGKYQFEQYCGRYERPDPNSGKSDSVVYYVWDWKVFGTSPLRNLSRWKPKVEVLWNGSWIPAKRFLKEDMISAKTDGQEDPLFQSVR